MHIKPHNKPPIPKKAINNNVLSINSDVWILSVTFDILFCFTLKSFIAIQVMLVVTAFYPSGISPISVYSGPPPISPPPIPAPISIPAISDPSPPAGPSIAAIRFVAEAFIANSASLSFLYFVLSLLSSSV